MKKIIKAIKAWMDRFKDIQKGASFLWFRDVKDTELNEYE